MLSDRVIEKYKVEKPYTKYLHATVYNGDLAAAKEFILEGADLDYHGSGILEPAVARNYVDMVKYFLSIHKFKQTALNISLFRACELCHHEMVKLLLDAGADVNHTEDDCIKWIGDGKNRFNVMRLLVEAGADINTDNGIVVRTEYAKGNKDILICLLDSGADATKINMKYDKSHSIDAERYKEIDEILLERLNAKN